MPYNWYHSSNVAEAFLVLLAADKLISGSLHGVLRIHSPSQRGLRPEDALLELKLGSPILQLEALRISRCVPPVR